jgi:Domain of unknown function (DUF4386)
MSSTRKTARFAGVLYFLMGIPAFFSLMYVPGKLIVRGDATATVANISASEWLFRLGIMSTLLSVVLFMFLALVLYRLFEEVNRQHSTILVILVLVQVPMAFLNEVSSLAALLLVRGAGFPAVFDKPKLDALAMLFLNLHHQGLVVSEIFWGLWLFPFGLLVYRSGFIPRILGAFLIVNGLAYLAISLTGLLAPRYYSAVFRAAFPALLGELAIQLWLVIVGARRWPPDAAALPDLRKIQGTGLPG